MSCSSLKKEGTLFVLLRALDRQAEQYEAEQGEQLQDMGHLDTGKLLRSGVKLIVLGK